MTAAAWVPCNSIPVALKHHRLLPPRGELPQVRVKAKGGSRKDDDTPVHGTGFLMHGATPRAPRRAKQPRLEPRVAERRVPPIVCEISGVMQCVPQSPSQ